jgi:mono/diheme cytochrome c family protein
VAFAYHKMRNPRIWDRGKIKKPYDKLKMPNFYFTEEEAEALVTYLLGRKPPRVTEALKVDYREPARGRIAAGRHLTRELNCVGCHQIEDNAATIQQFYRMRVGGKELFDEVNAPPYLRGEGAKVQHAWLFGFVQNVEMLRPWLKVRMPSFTLSAEQATTLAEYFAGLARYESEMLRDLRKPVTEYVSSAKQQPTVKLASATRAESGEGGSDLKPGGDWFEHPPLRSSTELLGQYAVENRLIGRYAIDPTAERSAPARVWGDVQDRTGFIQDLFDVHYPFVDAPRPLAPQPRFELGEQLLYELQCLKCHVLGDPSVPGANSNPTAPNLNFAFRRLRQGWFREWLKNPAWIQPGTKMPQLFPDMRSAFLEYGDNRAELEAKYGSTGEEQIELLLDFLYNAGLKNYTAIQPGGIAPTAPPSGEEELFEEEGAEEFFEEEGEGA